MRKQLLAGLFLLLGIAHTAWAQDRTITGKVTTAEDGTSLPGVNVAVKGTTRGATTDANGAYRLAVPSNAVLIFSAIGFFRQEIEVGNKTTVDVVLSNSNAQLDEVVVVGYGTSLSKREVTGATSNVRGKDIENLPVQSFDRALQGRAAGVQVLSNNGAPGGAVTVRIRGIGSISAGNAPLYIVDGVQLNTRNDGGGVASTNPLNFLNPNDIESIDVLKDPATAAIYGAQAGNGVVLITTKKGRAGAKTRVTLDVYRGIVQPVPTLDVLNTQDFIRVRTEAFQASRPTTEAPAIRTLVLQSLGFPTTLTDAEIATLPSYDWQSEAYRPGSIDNYALSMQGGNDRTTFFLSGAYNQQDASLINVDFRRLSLNLNLNHKLNNKLNLESGIKLATTRQRGPFGNAEGSLAFGAPQYSAPILLPFNPIYQENGSFYGLPGSGQSLVGDLNQNVIANANYIQSSVQTDQLVSNLALTYSLNSYLSVRALGAIDYRVLRSSFFGDPRLQDYYSVRGSLTEANRNNVNVTTNAVLSYNRTFAERHTVGFQGGFEYRQEIQEESNFNGQGFPTPELNTANAAAEPSSIGGFWTGFKRAGVFGNLRYDFNKRYLVSAILRYDGSSRFGVNNRWGLFPSISAKWLVTEEAFLKGNNVISDLGLRVSYGVTGNDQIGNFDSRRLFGLGGVYQGASAIRATGLGNPDLRWERNVTLNLGLDYALFSGRLKGSIDAFDRRSEDLLLTRSIPGINGFTSITENVGEVQNRGLEFEVTTVNLNRGGFRWETSFNVTWQDNKVLRLFEGVDVLPGNLSIRVGYPLGTNVANPYVGVNPSNGRPMWLDANDNITYLPRTADARPVGHSTFSSSFGGLTNTLSFKGFEVSAFFNYDFGRIVPNFQEFRLADNGGVARNSLQYYFDNRWTTPGQITAVPRPAENRTQLSGRVASYQTTARFYQDASFIRLKTLSVSYNLPTTWIQRLRLQNAKVYAQGVNLLTWTKWTGFDPEFIGSNEGIIPQSRQLTLGLQLGF